MIRSSGLVLLALLVVVLLLGCVSGHKAAETAPRRLKPHDFAAAPASDHRQTPPDDVARPSATPATTQAETAVASSTPRAGRQSVKRRAPLAKLGQVIDVDAMVGQVHGRPIYASEVFKTLDAELTALGQKFPRQVFRRRIVSPAPDGTRLIPDLLEGVVINALVLGDAERDLSDRHRSVVKNNLKEWREEILRQAMGSVSRADQDLHDSTGIGLEETMEELRKGLVVKMYMQNKLAPRITVTRRDIQNYYHRHIEQFNEPPGRLVRMISTKDPQQADQIDRLLKAGTPFIEVAAMRVNQYKAAQNGLFAERAEGARIFEHEAINDAVLNLKEGEHASRIAYEGKFVWVFVEKIYPGSHRPLTEAQTEIDRTLRTRQYAKLFNEYRSRLLREGSYTPIAHMTDILVQIATNRYVVSP